MSIIQTDLLSPASFVEDANEAHPKKSLNLGLKIKTSTALSFKLLTSLRLEGDRPSRAGTSRLSTASDEGVSDCQTNFSPASTITISDSDREGSITPELLSVDTSSVIHSKTHGLKLFSSPVSKTSPVSKMLRKQRGKYEPLVDKSLSEIKGLLIGNDIEVIKESDLGKVILRLGYEIIEQIPSNGANSYLLKLTKGQKTYLLKLAKVGSEYESISQILFRNGVIKDYIYDPNRSESSILKTYDKRIIKPEVILTYGDDGYETSPTEGSIHVGQIYPFIDGVDLIEHARNYRTGLPVSDLIHISYQLLETMAGLSSRNIFHRDIKPDNILILPNGMVAIIDFGQAKKVEDPTTRIESPLSKTAYRYPLRDKRLNHQQDEAWSMGATIYKITTGETPKTSVLSQPLHTKNDDLITEAASHWDTMSDTGEQVTIDIDLPEKLPTVFNEILRGLLSAEQMTIREAFERIAPLENLRIRLINSVIKSDADEAILASLSDMDRENALKLLPSVKNQVKVSLFDKHLSSLPSSSLIHFSDSEKLKFIQKNLKSQIREGILTLKTDGEIISSLSEVEGIVASPLLASLKDEIRASLVKALPEFFPSDSLVHFSLTELIKFAKNERINMPSD